MNSEMFAPAIGKNQRKTMSLKLLCIAAATVLLTGCYTPRQGTPSGRNEVTIAAPKAKVKAALVTAVVNLHFMPVQDTDYILTADGDASAGAQFWFTTTDGRVPKTRMRFTLIENDNQTRVIAAAALLTPGYGGYNEQEFTNPEIYNQLQWFLDCLAADMNGQPHPEKPPKLKIEPISSPHNQK